MHQLAERRRRLSVCAKASQRPLGPAPPRRPDGFSMQSHLGTCRHRNQHPRLVSSSPAAIPTSLSSTGTASRVWLCGCPTFTNLQFLLELNGALVTPLESGSCVALLSSGAMKLQPCNGAAGQVWSYNKSSGALAVVTSAGSVACLTAPPAPPPPEICAGVTVRAASDGRSIKGYSLRLVAGKGGSGSWKVLSDMVVKPTAPCPRPSTAVSHTNSNSCRKERPSPLR